jgi:hypothetical protein
MSESESLWTRWRKLRQQSKGAPQTARPVDVSTLPPLESLTSESDVIAFLQPGVPLDLLKAAFRQVWRADPAIREFVGVAEAQWDFNDPDAIAGFGPLDPLMDAQSVVRFSTASVTDAPGSIPDEAPNLNPGRDGQPDSVWGSVRQAGEAPAPVTHEVPSTAVEESSRAPDRPRRHGSALPKDS